jgi:hypothetical protein
MCVRRAAFASHRDWHDIDRPHEQLELHVHCHARSNFNVEAIKEDHKGSSAERH